jgi:farnesyl diphosphate synthase
VPLGASALTSGGRGCGQAFLACFRTLSDEILDQDAVVTAQPAHAKEWLREMFDYNVPKGKLNRGMAVLDALRAIKGADLGEAEVFKANALGWCIEWLQAFFLVADDMMDESITRRGQPCWYKLPKVGTVACNDSILLEAAIYRILRRHFGDHPQYVRLLDLFLETTFQTSCGQLLDILTAPIGEVDVSKYTLEAYRNIVVYKTAFYSFYLPVACGMVLAGVDDPAAFEKAKSICIQMGEYFQVQDDYLDNYGAPEVIGKIGTDIEDNKCSWLICQALLKVTPEQKAVITENYGRKDEACVQKIKALFNELELEALFKSYEQSSYEKLTREISEQKLVNEEVFLKLLRKIYKRSK